MFGKDARMFAYEPMDGYRDGRDAVELPWERWEHEARARGVAVADIVARGDGNEPPGPA